MDTDLRAGPQRERREVERGIGAAGERNAGEEDGDLRRARASHRERGERVVGTESPDVNAGERLDQARGVGDLARRILELRARHETSRLRRAAHADFLFFCMRRRGEEDYGQTGAKKMGVRVTHSSSERGS
jgi:hypothetical protein